MSIKGFPSQKKLTTQLPSFTDKQSVTTNEFITAQPSSSDRIALDAISLSAFRLHGTVKTAEAGATYPKRELISTSHGAQKGDIVRFELASENPYFEASVLSVPDADTIILGAELPNNINTGDEFFILRYTTPRSNADGTPVIAVTSAVNTDGSVVNGTLSTTVANSESVPSGAVGFFLMNESTNSNPIRFRIGGVASTTAGVLLEPGRSSDYVPIAAAISICNTVSSTQSYNLLWVIA